MSTQGKIKTLFSDKEKTEALFPRTKLSAVSDENGKGLNAILDDMAYVGDITEDVASTPVNADLLGGRPAGEYATQNYVANEIAKAQLGGNGADLSGYATKDEVSAAVNGIDFPVDSVNGRTGAITLSASDVGAAPDGILPQQATGNLVSVIDSGDAPLHDLKIYGKTTQNGTPTPENPVELESVGADGSIGVTVCGKNLLQNTAKTTTVQGITFTVNADGSVTVNGTNTASAATILSLCEYSFVSGEQYVLSGLIGSTAQQMHIWTQSNTAFPVGSRLQCFNGEVKRTAQASETCVIRIQVEPNVTINNVTIYPMLRLASVTDNTYEPYKGQTITASTPNGLPGIPVSSGGNYTDENGQMWICDEVDFSRGVYMQRVKAVNLADMSGGHNGTNFYFTSIKDKRLGLSNVLCSHFPQRGITAGVYCTGSTKEPYLFIYGSQYTNVADLKAAHSDMEFIYELETPIETPLSAEELAAYAALHTNHPNTTVYNDAGAHMEMEYYSPISAVPVDMGEGAKGKALVVDENGHVAPMKLTAADVGAAPSGFGLGDKAVTAPNNDANQITKCGFYRAYVNTPTGDWWTIQQEDLYGNGTHMIQKASCFAYTFVLHAERMVVDGKFYEWEWVNPPMVLGKEYRTTERWNGKAVYTMLVNINSIATGTSTAPVDTTVDVTVNGITKVVEYQVYITWNHETVSGLVYTASPNADNGIIATWTYARPDQNKLRVGVKANADVSGKTAHAIVKYIKD